MQVNQNADSDPIFQKDLDMEYDPKKSDRSEACVYVDRPINYLLIEPAVLVCRRWLAVGHWAAVLDFPIATA
jgi:hypothetical protein